jgi:hypothetical protein
LQTSVVQRSLSSQSAGVSQLGMVVWEQSPAAQTSRVAGTPSSQSALFWQHPGYSLKGPAHDPEEHASGLVHAFRSEQGAVLNAWAHPVGDTQSSSVQTFPSSQFRAPPPATHAPSEQTSPVVQASPSLHETALFACAHVPPVHASSVQTLASSQSAEVRQHPGIGLFSQALLALQTSLVHAFPSSHSALVEQLDEVVNV